MAMWESASVKDFIVPVLHLQIGLGNYVLNKLLDFIESDLEKLSIAEEVDHNTLVTWNQVIEKICQESQIWDVNYGIMLEHKSIQKNRLQAMK